MMRCNPMLLAAALLLALAAPASAQSYPSGTIKIMVGFTPGGTTDIIARDVAIELEKAWHNTVIVENRAGANGALAAAQLAKAAPDGYTLMMVVSGHITDPLIMANAGYDPLKDFTNISLLASSPLLIFAHPGFAANDIKGAIALAKEKPSTIGYATPGVGSIQQLSMELLSYLSGAKSACAVSRRGPCPERHHRGARADQRAERVPGVAADPGRQARAARRHRAQTKRCVAGHPDRCRGRRRQLRASLLFGLIAPAGLPSDVLQKLNAEVVRIINDPGMKKKLAAQCVLRSQARLRTSPASSRPSSRNGGRDQGRQHQGMKEARPASALERFLYRQQPVRFVRHLGLHRGTRTIDVADPIRGAGPIVEQDAAGLVAVGRGEQHPTDVGLREAKRRIVRIECNGAKQAGRAAFGQAADRESAFRANTRLGSLANRTPAPTTASAAAPQWPLKRARHLKRFGAAAGSSFIQSDFIVRPFSRRNMTRGNPLRVPDYIKTI